MTSVELSMQSQETQFFLLENCFIVHFSSWVKIIFLHVHMNKRSDVEVAPFFFSFFFPLMKYNNSSVILVLGL